MSESLVERLRILLAEKFKLKPEEIELPGPLPTVKWRMIARPYPYVYGVFIEAYENGKIEIDTGSEPTKSEICGYLGRKKYDRRYEGAKTKEEKEKVLREELEETRRIIEDFKQGRFEKYLKKEKDIAYYAKKHMWADEIAKRVSDKHGLDVKFEIDFESGFFTIFNSTGMSDEQIIDEILRRVDAIAEAREMLLSEGMMNEFLISRGIEVERLRHSRKHAK